MSPTHTLIDDAALVDAPRLADVLTRWTSATPCPASLVVSDAQLAALDRLASQRLASDHPVPVTVVNTTGAGGLVSLAARSTPHLEIVAVRSALRDLDDLTGNAARVVSAAAELTEKIEVYVELPDAWGWQRAAAVVESSGLYAGLSAEPTTEQTPSDGCSTTPRPTGLPVDPGLPVGPGLMRRMSALIELDLGFALDARALDPRALPGLLAAVDALIDDAPVDEATDLLRGTAPIDLSTWDSSRHARTARRLRRVLTSDPAAARRALAAAGISAAVIDAAGIYPV